MINRTFKVAFFLLLVLPFFSVAAVSSPSEKCSTIQDAKKRLNCYDSVAKQTLNESSRITAEQEKITNQTQTNIESQVKADRVVLVEAGLVYKSGDIKPVARTEFYLLDDSLVEIFKNANIKYPMNTDENAPNYLELIYPRAIVMAFGQISTKIDQLSDSSPQTQRIKDFHSKAIAAIAPHIIQNRTTDFSGHVKFESIKPGTYYLMGVHNTPRGVAVWNSMIDVKNLETTVILDQNNAAYVK